jgi:hypothetical protein
MPTLVAYGACSAIHLQRGNERFLRDVDLAELPHLLLAFLLLLQKLAFARDVAVATASSFPSTAFRSNNLDC